MKSGKKPSNCAIYPQRNSTPYQYSYIPTEKQINKMKKILKWIAISIFSLLFLSSLGFILWAENPLGPGAEAVKALQSDSAVTVNQLPAYTTFTPANQQPQSAFIFYPGGRVDYRSYAPALRMIAEQGTLVILVPVRLNLAFFDIEAAQKALDDFPQIKHWAIGGHSLGGVAAAIFAQKQPKIEGIAFWASYPADDSLKNTSLKITSISASADGLSTIAKIEASRALLPAQTTYISIQGGNHAGFGDYGLQPGDGTANITKSEQWSQTASATVQLMQSLATP